MRREHAIGLDGEHEAVWSSSTILGSGSVSGPSLV